MQAAAQLLGIDLGNFSEADVQRAFREKAKNVHPDKSERPDATAEFQALLTARDCLQDAAQRFNTSSAEQKGAPPPPPGARENRGSATE